MKTVKRFLFWISISFLLTTVCGIDKAHSQTKESENDTRLDKQVKDFLSSSRYSWRFLEDPEGSWRELIKENKMKYQISLFPELEGLIFEKK